MLKLHEDTVSMIDNEKDVLLIQQLSGKGNYYITIVPNSREDISQNLQELIDKCEFDGIDLTKEMVMEELDIALNIETNQLLTYLRAIVTTIEMRCKDELHYGKQTKK